MSLEYVFFCFVLYLFFFYLVVDERHTATDENQLEPIAKGIHLSALDDLKYH